MFEEYDFQCDVLYRRYHDNYLLRLLLIAGTNFSEFSGNQQNAKIYAR